MTDIYIPEKQKLYITDHKEDCAKLYYRPAIKNFYLKRIQLIISLIVRNGQTALDVGCGSGILFYEFSKRFSNLHGIDLRTNISGVKKSLYREGIKVNLINGDAQELPYKDASFDCVIAMSVLEHIQDVKKPIEEIKRVLKSEGSFICGFPAKNFFTRQFLKIVNCDAKEGHPSGHKEIYDALRRNFDIEKIIKFPFFLTMYHACRCKKR